MFTQLQTFGVSFNQADKSPLHVPQGIARYRIAASKQPRGKHKMQLIPEFRNMIKLEIDADVFKTMSGELNSKRRLQKTMIVQGQTLIQGSKVLEIKGEGERAPRKKEDKGSEDKGSEGGAEDQDAEWQGKRTRKNDKRRIKVGEYHTPEEWHSKVVKLQHPASIVAAVDKQTAQAIAGCLSRTPEETMVFRKESIVRYTKIAEELRAQEEPYMQRCHLELQMQLKERGSSCSSEFWRTASCHTKKPSEG